MNKKIARLVVLVVITHLGAMFIVAQEDTKYDMGKMQMVFLTDLPEWKPKDSSHADRIKREQRQFVDGLVRSGRCAIAGPTAGSGPVREIMVFKTESADDVKALAKTFPVIKAGMMKAEVLSWFAAKNYLKAPETPMSTARYVFGLLVRGPKWTPEKTPETNNIQEGHMANINRLAQLGKLVLAGPFYDEGERRGVFIFKVDSLDEAQTLTDTDPAVMAGRLRIDLYYWTVSKGILN